MKRRPKNTKRKAEKIISVMFLWLIQKCIFVFFVLFVYTQMTHRFTVDISVMSRR